MAKATKPKKETKPKADKPKKEKALTGGYFLGGQWYPAVPAKE